MNKKIKKEQQWDERKKLNEKIVTYLTEISASRVAVSRSRKERERKGRADQKPIGRGGRHTDQKVKNDENWRNGDDDKVENVYGCVLAKDVVGVHCKSRDGAIKNKNTNKNKRINA